MKQNKCLFGVILGFESVLVGSKFFPVRGLLSAFPMGRARHSAEMMLTRESLIVGAPLRSVSLRTGEDGNMIISSTNKALRVPRGPD